MAVTMMCSADKASQDNVVRVDNYPGHEISTVNHYDGCKTFKESGQGYCYSERNGKVRDTCCDRCSHYDPLYLETTYKGCVLNTYERNGYDDSDFYAVCWDEKAGKVVTILYASTRGWTYPNGATVDATPEIRERAAQAMFDNGIDSHLSFIMESEREKAKADIQKNSIVQVFKGRKVPIGVMGKVFWKKETQYGVKIGMTVENPQDFPNHNFDVSKYGGGLIAWTYAKNVENVAWQESMPSEETISARFMANCRYNCGLA